MGPKLLMALGVVMVIYGLFGSMHIGDYRFGHLPGDILIENENSRFYFPVTSCLVASGVISTVLWLFFKDRQ